MGDEAFLQHYVCTHQQERDLVSHYQRFWLGTCGCRSAGAGCKRSGTEVCLTFSAGSQGSHPHRYEVTRAQVDEVLKVTEHQHLVSRPFRDMSNKDVIEGVCHCCDDCCSYFLNPEEVCDKGTFIETTDMVSCTQCGQCAEVCYFNARMMVSGALTLHREECYGCGLCAEVCPANAIKMIPRLGS